MITNDKEVPVLPDGSPNGFALTGNSTPVTYKKIILVDFEGNPIILGSGAGDTITGITSQVAGNDIILNVATDGNPTGFVTTLTDALKDIVGDLASATLTGGTLTLTMTTGTVKTVDLSQYVTETELANATTKISMRRSERTGLNQQINSNQAFNLLNLIRPQDLVFNDDNLVYTFLGTGANQVVRFPYVKDRCIIAFKVRLTGDIGGSPNTARDWIIEVRRPNDEVLDSKVTTKANTNNLNRESTDIMSFMRGASDPFIIDGVKLFLNNTTGQGMIINSIQLTTILTY